MSIFVNAKSRETEQKAPPIIRMREKGNTLTCIVKIRIQYSFQQTTFHIKINAISESNQSISPIYILYKIIIYYIFNANLSLNHFSSSHKTQILFFNFNFQILTFIPSLTLVVTELEQNFHFWREKPTEKN